jgi:AcrR family transcriptional regulator
MVMRYYGSKEGLFAATVDLDLRLPDAESPPDQLGARLALHFIAIWEVEPARGALLVLLRSAATYPAAAQRMRAVFLDQVLAMVRRATGDAEDAAVRAGLITSQVLGTALCRYVLALPPMVAMDAQALAAVLGPQLQHCLTGPLNA